MSKNSPFTTLCTRTDKVFKIWYLQACIALIGIVCQFIFNAIIPYAVSVVVSLFATVGLFIWYLDWRKKLMTDLSKMLLDTTSPHHEDIKFLKKSY